MPIFRSLNRLFRRGARHVAAPPRIEPDRDHLQQMIVNVDQMVRLNQEVFGVQGQAAAQQQGMGQAQAAAQQQVYFREYNARDLANIQYGMYGNGEVVHRGEAPQQRPRADIPRSLGELSRAFAVENMYFTEIIVSQDSFFKLQQLIPQPRVGIGLDEPWRIPDPPTELIYRTAMGPIKITCNEFRKPEFNLKDYIEVVD